MTEYTQTPARWRAIQWDGTNVQDVIDFLQPVNGYVLTSAVSAGDPSLVLVVSGQIVGSVYSWQPWIVTEQPNYVSPVAVRIVEDDNGAPRGFDAV